MLFRSDNAPITVYGTGQQSRCFCYVQDTIQAMLRLVATDKAVGEVINVGSTEEISIESLAHLVKKHARSDSPITHVPYAQAYEPGFEDMLRRVPAVEKLEKITGFRPSVPLTEIVDRVIEFFQEKTTPQTGRPKAGAASETPQRMAAETSEIGRASWRARV